jgi:hypothetical protein
LFFVIISAQFHFAHQYVTVPSDTVVWRVWKKPFNAQVVLFVIFFILHIFNWFYFFELIVMECLILPYEFCITLYIV